MLHKRLSRYLASLILACFSMIFVAGTQHILGDTVFFVPLAAVVVVALIAGFGPSLLAAALTTIGLLLFLPPIDQYAPEDMARLSIFVGLSTGLCYLIRTLRRAEAAERIAQSQVNTLETERALREKFVSNLSHDLRSPLTAAKSGVELVLKMRAQEADRIPKLLAVVLDSVNRTDRMISDLLDANRIRAGEKIPLKLADCDVSQVVKETLLVLSTVYGERFVFEAEPVRIGSWDPSGIRRILENLIDNALKYGKSGTLVTVRVRELNDKSGVELSVHNEGIVIGSKKEQQRLFEPFQRLSVAVDSGQPGWGLGLTLVRGLVEAHHGRVEFESTRDGGTTFYISLPYQADRASPPAERDARYLRGAHS